MKLSIALLGCAAVVLVTPFLAQNQQPTPAIQDWTLNHVIFAQLASPDLAIRLRDEPRFWFAWLTRNQPYLHGNLATPGYPPRRPESDIRIDWAVALGTNAGVADGAFPAKFSFNVTATPSCTGDFAVFPINATPSASQANLMGLDNLYSGTSPAGLCSGSAATFLWAYEIGSSAISTSPVISAGEAGDTAGSKIAVIESATSASFHVLTWKSGTGNGTSATAAVKPGTGNSAALTSLAYTTLGGSACATTAATNSRSSPYVDYQHDTAYVGDNHGRLFKITPVFGTGTPAVTGCVQLGSTSAVMTSPVVDPATGNIFISDGAKLYMVSANFTTTAAPTVNSSATVATAITDPPIIDTANKFAYLFIKADSTNKFSAVMQLPFTSTALTTGSEVTGRLDGGSASVEAGTTLFHTGAFDDLYSSSSPSAGTLYACGPQSTSASKAALYAFSFAPTTFKMNATPVVNGDAGVTGSSTVVQGCSPLTEFKNGSIDYLFLSQTAIGAPSTTTDEMEQWTITRRITTSTSPTATNSGNQDAYGGTSGIIVDNSSTSAQASSLYFGTLTKGNSKGASPCGKDYCAIKLTQSTLQ